MTSGLDLQMLDYRLKLKLDYYYKLFKQAVDAILSSR